MHCLGLGMHICVYQQNGFLGKVNINDFLFTTVGLFQSGLHSLNGRYPWATNGESLSSYHLLEHKILQYMLFNVANQMSAECLVSIKYTNTKLESVPLPPWVCQRDVFRQLSTGTWTFKTPKDQAGVNMAVLYLLCCVCFHYNFSVTFIVNNVDSCLIIYSVRR